MKTIKKLTTTFLLILLLTSQLYAESGADHGRGNLGKDLLDYKEIDSPRLRRLNQDVIDKIGQLDLSQIPELKRLKVELGSPLLEMSEDMYKDPNQHPGDWRFGGLLYGYTDLRQGAPTLIYPIALSDPNPAPTRHTTPNSPKGLTDNQLKQLLLHEALHRTLPAPLNGWENVVSELTKILLLYSPEAIPQVVSEYFTSLEGNLEIIEVQLPAVLPTQFFPAFDFNQSGKMGHQKAIHFKGGAIKFPYATAITELFEKEFNIGRWFRLRFVDGDGHSSMRYNARIDLSGLSNATYAYETMNHEGYFYPLFGNPIEAFHDSPCQWIMLTSFAEVPLDGVVSVQLTDVKTNLKRTAYGQTGDLLAKAAPVSIRKTFKLSRRVSQCSEVYEVRRPMNPFSDHVAKYYNTKLGPRKRNYESIYVLKEEEWKVTERSHVQNARSRQIEVIKKTIIQTVIKALNLN